VAITHAHRVWLKGRRRGTVAQLIAAAAGNWPTAGTTTPHTLYGTSYLLGEELVAALEREAERQGTSAGAVVRAILDRAVAAHPLHDAA
jgi:hypothetical protein